MQTFSESINVFNPVKIQQTSVHYLD